MSFRFAMLTFGLALCMRAHIAAFSLLSLTLVNATQACALACAHGASLTRLPTFTHFLQVKEFTYKNYQFQARAVQEGLTMINNGLAAVRCGKAYVWYFHSHFSFEISRMITYCS
jgi:hypothetical protein